MFNKNLLTQYSEPQFKEQYMNVVLLPDIINKEKEYEVEEVQNHRKWEHCQKYSMKYIYSTSQMSKLSLILCTFSVTGSVTSLFLT